MRTKEKKARKKRAKNDQDGPANPALPAILARLKASRAFSIRAALRVCRSLIIGETFIGNLRKGHFKTVANR